jgi:polysaccharide export outer membrane protein
MREVLGAGDSVRITAFRYPELTTEVRLSEEGRVTVPLIGEINLQGMTPDQAGKHIADRMKKGNYLVDPQIGVTVLQARSRQVSVLGFVARPGRYSLEGTTARVADVIAMAGGLQPTASDTITVQSHRGGRTEKIDIDFPAILRDASLNIEVQSGDTVFVPRASMFYIYGEVVRAGSYRIEPGMTVMQAISVAGGLTLRGTDNGPRLRRREANGSWKETTAKLIDPVFPDDIIFVREGLF